MFLSARRIHFIFFCKVAFIFFWGSFFLFKTAWGGSKVKKSFESIISGCALCHGSDGNAKNTLYPKLAGQSVNYLVKELKDFNRQGEYRRDSPVMSLLAAGLSEKEKMKIADYYNSLVGSIDAADPSVVSLGQQLYRGGDFDKGIPACLACHGPAGLGNPAAGFPRLSGQHARYITEQLKAFRLGIRHNDKNQMMQIIAKKMDDSAIAAVASYISGLYFNIKVIEKGINPF